MKGNGCIILLFFLAGLCNRLHSQKTTAKQNLVYVDKQGVLRYSKDKSEAAFFGVNYTVPFAYGYRSHKALGVDLHTAIAQDVYHFSRLGLDAFRVHIWDTEITDSLGNLLANEHLDLFDYLLQQLESRNIRIIITPIAFWGNGYPERDEMTPGFSRVYGKDQSVVKEEPIRAQENYLKQLMNHVNPYTKTSYKDDQNIIAVELNNEPHHSGPKAKTTEYINRLATAVRGTGWTKPVFYNISESPFYSDAVAASQTEGHSFQWYPSGLVAGHEQKGNFLPNVDQYTIPFDSVPAFHNKAKMVYEFDAADILQSNMYPAMARSYRSAGFQWCTQFAYDPMATAYANTEYQTHYLNLAYTPSKAISLLIASKVFHKIPRNQNYGVFPADTIFGDFRVSYKNSLSEMNSDEEFYYSNSTDTKPKNVSKLKHVAGVGNSPIVQYDGTGAYFLDKLQEGSWQLEVMPDVIQIKDPFEKASPKKEVTRIQWTINKIHIKLPDLGEDLFIYPLINFAMANGSGSAFVYPGKYLIHTANSHWEFFSKQSYVAPEEKSTDIVLSHIPYVEVTENKSFIISAKIAGLSHPQSLINYNPDSLDKVLLEVRSAPRWRTIPMNSVRTGEYIAEVPADVAVPGILNYRIIIQRTNNEYYTFPGNAQGNPYAWDNTNNETWQTTVVTSNTGLEIFNTNIDRTNLIQYNPDWRNNTFRFVASERSSQLAVKITAKNLTDKQSIGFQLFVGDKLKGRQSELSSFKTLVVRVRSENSAKAKLSLITNDALCFSQTIDASVNWTNVSVPLNNMQIDSFLLLPRPYPGFLPLWFHSKATGSLNIEDIDKLQVICIGENKPADLEIAAAWLEK